MNFIINNLIMNEEENTTILRDIALEIFHIRKIRFLMSAPSKDIQ